MRRGVTPDQVSLYHQTPPYDMASSVARKSKQKGTEGRQAVPGRVPPYSFLLTEQLLPCALQTCSLWGPGPRDRILATTPPWPG